MGRGLTWMLVGLGLFGLAGFVFFVSCLGGGLGAGKIGLIATIVLAVAGALAMAIGFVIALAEVLRR
jgi:hypothetical protein